MTRAVPPDAATPLGDAAEGMAALWPALLLMTVGLVGLLLATVFSNPISGHYVVVSAPFSDRMAPVRLISAAQGAMVAPGGFDNVMIAQSTDPNFSTELRRLGAWMVFPAPRYLGCGEPPALGAKL